MHVEGDSAGIFSKAVLEHMLLRSTSLGCKIRCVTAHHIFFYIQQILLQKFIYGII